MKFKRADADDAWHFLNIFDPSLATCKCCSSGAACDKWVNWITRIVDVKKENPENLPRETSAATPQKEISLEKQFSVRKRSEDSFKCEFIIVNCQWKSKKAARLIAWISNLKTFMKLLLAFWSSLSTTELALSIFQVFVKFFLCIISTLKGVIACRSDVHLDQAGK